MTASQALSQLSYSPTQVLAARGSPVPGRLTALRSRPQAGTARIADQLTGTPRSLQAGAIRARKPALHAGAASHTRRPSTVPANGAVAARDRKIDSRVRGDDVHRALDRVALGFERAGDAP